MPPSRSIIMVYHSKAIIFLISLFLGGHTHLQTVTKSMPLKSYIPSKIMCTIHLIVVCGDALKPTIKINEFFSLLPLSICAILFCNSNENINKQLCILIETQGINQSSSTINLFFEYHNIFQYYNSKILDLVMFVKVVSHHIKNFKNLVLAFESAFLARILF